MSNLSAATGHFIDVQMTADWSQFRPHSTCGWVGTYTAQLRGAEREGMAHVHATAEVPA